MAQLLGSTKRWIVSKSATHARDEDRGTTTARELLAADERRKNAIPSGTAVSASPELWIRSARSATEFESRKTATCATAAARARRG